MNLQAALTISRQPRRTAHYFCGRWFLDSQNLRVRSQLEDGQRSHKKILDLLHRLLL